MRLTNGYSFRYNLNSLVAEILGALVIPLELRSALEQQLTNSFRVFFWCSFWSSEDFRVQIFFFFVR